MWQRASQWWRVLLLKCLVTQVSWFESCLTRSVFVSLGARHCALLTVYCKPYGIPRGRYIIVDCCVPLSVNQWHWGPLAPYKEL